MYGTGQWSYVDSYMTWFYNVSHLVITPDAHLRQLMGRSWRIRDDHAIDVLPIYQNIMRLMYEGVEYRLFKRGDDDAVALAYVILIESQNSLGYR